MFAAQIAVALLTGCAPTGDAVPQAEKQDSREEANPQSIAEMKDIGEEAFIYGFPMVMNYGTMYEYFVDESSPQYKCPFNQIYNTARVFTPQDTAIVTPNSDTPYSFIGADLRAEPIVGFEKIAQRVENIGKDVNGWRIGSALGDRAFFRGDWLLRAAAAKAGIYGNDAVEATYPLTRNDVDGEPLDGAKHNYTLTFPAESLPPVNAFWSVTMYDGKSQLLIENPIDRYLINSPMLPGLKENDDGSLTLYIQKDSPGDDKESNWLPAPDGPMYIVMRLYWPKEEPPSVLPPGEGTWSPPGIVKVN